MHYVRTGISYPTLEVSLQYLWRMEIIQYSCLVPYTSQDPVTIPSHKDPSGYQPATVPATVYHRRGGSWVGYPTLYSTHIVRVQLTTRGEAGGTPYPRYEYELITNYIALVVLSV